jgi:hypothetical protein
VAPGVGCKQGGNTNNCVPRRCTLERGRRACDVCPAAVPAAAERDDGQGALACRARLRCRRRQLARLAAARRMVSSSFTLPVYARAARCLC